MMIQWSEVDIYLSKDAIDMRKAINGLVVLVIDALGKMPTEQGVYVFYNKERDKVKCLWWDKNGFVMYYKRLEKGRYKIPKNLPSTGLSLNKNELSWLLAGLDFHLMKENADLDFSDYF